MSSVVALEFPYGVRRGTPKVFDAQGLISVRERYSAADEFAFNLIERRTEENGQISTPFRCSEFLPFCIAQTSS